MRISNFRRALIGGLALTLSLSPALRAQDSAAAECDKAAKVIARGHPADTDDWAFIALRRCGGSGARAFAEGVGHYAAETQIATLESFMTAVDNWRDASILEAVSRLATDPSASPQARVFAVRHLIVLLQPYHLFTYAGLAKGVDTTKVGDLITWTPGCPAQMTSAPRGQLKGSPLPPDYETRIRATLASLSSSSSTPAPVRNAARCVFPPR